MVEKNHRSTKDKVNPDNARVKKRSIVDLLPVVHQTSTLQKFFNATADQLFQPQQSEETNGYIGEKPPYYDKAVDFYVQEPTKSREFYQLTTAMVQKNTESNELENVLFYPDIANSLRFNGGIVDNHNRLFNQDFYSWSPPIDLDKIINATNYYWLPFGSEPVSFSEYRTLHVGNGIQSVYPIPETPDLTDYPGVSVELQVTINGIEIPQYVSGELQETYYQIDGNNILISPTPDRNSRVIIKYVSNFQTDIESIIGKEHAEIEYYPGKTLVLSSGTTIRVNNDVNPEYNDKIWVVEGVGREIRLFEDTVSNYSWDNFKWDTITWDQTNDYMDPDYTVMERTAIDSNPWSTGNRWFHKSVIQNFDDPALVKIKASRPIIEFKRDLELYNYGIYNRDPIQIAVTNIDDLLSRLNGISIVGFDRTDYYLCPSRYNPNMLVWRSAPCNKNINDPDYVDIEIRRAGWDSTPWDFTFWDVETVWPEYLSGQSEIYINGIPLTDGTRVLITDSLDDESRNKVYRITGVAPTFNEQMLQYNESTDTWVNVNGVIFSGSFPQGGSAGDLLLNTGDGKLYEYDGSIWVENTRFSFSFNRPIDPEDGDYWYKNNGGRIFFQLENDGLDQVGNPVYGEVLPLRNQLETTVQYWFNGTTWVQTQRKTGVNQAPLFNLYDIDGAYLGDQAVYPENNFEGNKIFSFKVNEDQNAPRDSVLGIKLSYDNFGEILYENHIVTDEYNYRLDAKTLPITGYRFHKVQSMNEDDVIYSNDWHLVDYKSPQYFGQRFVVDSEGTNTFTLRVDPIEDHNVLLNYVRVNGRDLNEDEYYFDENILIINEDLVEPNDDIECQIWGNLVLESSTRFFDQKFVYQGLNGFKLQFKPIVPLADINMKVSINGQAVDLSQVSLVDGTLDVLQLNDVVLQLGDEIFVSYLIRNVFTDGTEGFYKAPLNLEANPDNEEITFISKTNFFHHFCSNIENQIGLTGNLIGTNNYRDTSKVSWYGTKIVQHTAPLLKTMLMISNSDFDVMKSLRYVEREYSRFKNKFLHQIMTIWKSGRLDESSSDDEWFEEIFKRLNIGKNREFPFYNSHMLGGTYWIPPTPSYLGVMPAYMPSMYLDNTFLDTTEVIQGHDGSITVAYGDIRDRLLLALEQRIYDSIDVKFKGETRPFFDTLEYRPGAFRETEWDRFDYNAILQPAFERWVVKNQALYRENSTYDEFNRFTWNYNTSRDYRGQTVPGNWRGIYQYFYDTDRPHTHPWEMLGFTEKPIWWDAEYGVAPYTSGNTHLWSHIRDGVIAHGARAGQYDHLARPDIFAILPVDSVGNLVDPISAGIIQTPPTRIQAQASWNFGDMGPVESAWSQSSEYVYALCQSWYLMKPAEFVELNWNPLDTEYVQLSEKSDPQWIYRSTRNRPRSSEIFVHGEQREGQPVINYGIQQFVTSLIESNGQQASRFGSAIRGLGVQLGYRVAGFIDNNNLKVLTDSFGIIPKENIQTLLYRSPSTKEAFYGGVIIEKTNKGWRVYGYDVLDPTFKTIPGDINGKRVRIELGSKTVNVMEWQPNLNYNLNDIVKINENFFKATQPHVSGTHFEPRYWVSVRQPTSTPEVAVNKYLEPVLGSPVVRVPYGTEFSTRQEVFNFLIAYERFLKSEGWVFDEVTEDNTSLDFTMSGKQFLTWSLNNWADGSVITLSPLSEKIKFRSELGQIQSVEQIVNGVYSILNRSGSLIEPHNTNVTRYDSEIEVTPTDTSNVDNLIYALRLYVSEIEHVVLLDNLTLFNDYIYAPLYSDKQLRLRLSAIKTKGWTGRVDAPGFLVTDNMIIPNYEKTTNDFRLFYDIDNQVDVEKNKKHANHVIGYQNRSYLDSLIISDKSQLQFYQGMIKQKGTPGSLYRLLRSEFVTRSTEIEFFEEWAFKVGRYGATDVRPSLEIKLSKDEIEQNPQMVEFQSINVDELDINSEEYKDYLAIHSKEDWYKWFDKHYIAKDRDDVITIFTAINNYGQILAGDRRYMLRPDETISQYTGQMFAQRDFGVEKDDLPNAGPVREGDYDYVVWNKRELFELEDTINAQQTTLKPGNVIWMYDTTGISYTKFPRDWSLFRVHSINNHITNIFDTFEQIPNADSIRIGIEFAHAHNLKLGDMLIVEPKIDLGGYQEQRFYEIIEIYDDFTVVILSEDLSDVTEEEIFPDLFTLREVRFESVYEERSYKDYLNDPIVVNDKPVHLDLIWVDDGRTFDEISNNKEKHWKTYETYTLQNSASALVYDDTASNAIKDHSSLVYVPSLGPSDRDDGLWFYNEIDESDIKYSHFVNLDIPGTQSFVVPSIEEPLRTDVLWMDRKDQTLNKFDFAYSVDFETQDSWYEINVITGNAIYYDLTHGGQVDITVSDGSNSLNTSVDVTDWSINGDTVLDPNEFVVGFNQFMATEILNAGINGFVYARILNDTLVEIRTTNLVTVEISDINGQIIDDMFGMSPISTSNSAVIHPTSNSLKVEVRSNQGAIGKDIQIDGREHDSVLIRLRRVYGYNWNGKLAWDTGNGFENSVSIPEPENFNEFQTVLIKPTTGWTNSNNNVIRIQLEFGEGNSMYEVDFMQIGSWKDLKLEVTNVLDENGEVEHNSLRASNTQSVELDVYLGEGVGSWANTVLDSFWYEGKISTQELGYYTSVNSLNEIVLYDTAFDPDPSNNNPLIAWDPQVGRLRLKATNYELAPTNLVYVKASNQMVNYDNFRNNVVGLFDNQLWYNSTDIDEDTTWYKTVKTVVAGVLDDYLDSNYFNISVIYDTLLNRFYENSGSQWELFEGVEDKIYFDITDSHLVLYKNNAIFDVELSAHLYPLETVVQSMAGLVLYPRKVQTIEAGTRIVDVGPFIRVRREEIKKTDVKTIKNAIIYNTGTNFIDSSLQVFDPYKGVIPGVAEKEIWYKLPYDPAKYTSGDETLYQVDVNQAWGPKQVGRLWWDTSRVRYLEYEIEDGYYYDSDNNVVRYRHGHEYRRRNWGKLAPLASIDVYEWVRSTLTPTQYFAKAASLSTLDVNVGSEDPSGEEYTAETPFVQRTEFNRNGDPITVYYFWVKNKKTIPAVDFRENSAFTVANIITNPTLSGITWCAPICTNEFIVSNVGNTVTSSESILQLNWRLNECNGNIHQQFALGQQDSDWTPPDALKNKMVDSLTGYTEYELETMIVASTPFSLTLANTNMMEKQGTLRLSLTNTQQLELRYVDLVDDTVILEDAAPQELLVGSNATYIGTLPVPDPMLSEIEKLGNRIRPRQTWFTDITKARKAFVEIANRVLQNTLVIRERLDWDKRIHSSSPEPRPTEYHFIVNNFEDRDFLVNNSNINVGDKVLVRGNSNSGNFWSVWELVTANPLSWKVTDSQIFKLDDFWSFADYYRSDLDPDNKPLRSFASMHELTLELNAGLVLQLNEIIEIRTNNDGVWEWLEYQGQTPFDQPDLKTVALQGGTIKLNDTLWSNEERYLSVFDYLTDNRQDYARRVNNRDGSLELRQLVDILMTDIFDVHQVNEMFFSVINYVFTDQRMVDWAFKTSHIVIASFGEVLSTYPVILPDIINPLYSYIEEVKPYHVKVRDFVRQIKSALDDSHWKVTDFDKPPYYDADLDQYRILDETNPNDKEILETQRPWSDWYNATQTNDSLIRRLRTSVKFDRVDCQANDSDPYILTLRTLELTNRLRMYQNDILGSVYPVDPEYQVGVKTVDIEFVKALREISVENSTVLSQVANGTDDTYTFTAPGKVTEYEIKVNNITLTEGDDFVVTNMSDGDSDLSSLTIVGSPEDEIEDLLKTEMTVQFTEVPEPGASIKISIKYTIDAFVLQNLKSNKLLFNIVNEHGQELDFEYRYIVQPHNIMAIFSIKDDITGFSTAKVLGWTNFEFNLPGFVSQYKEMDVFETSGYVLSSNDYKFNPSTRNMRIYRLAEYSVATEYNLPLGVEGRTVYVRSNKKYLVYTNGQWVDQYKPKDTVIMRMYFVDYSWSPDGIESVSIKSIVSNTEIELAPSQYKIELVGDNESPTGYVWQFELLNGTLDPDSYVEIKRRLFAAERIEYNYSPTATNIYGRPIVDIAPEKDSGLISGCDFAGTRRDGLQFFSGGWDLYPWDTLPWDSNQYPMGTFDRYIQGGYVDHEQFVGDGVTDSFTTINPIQQDANGKHLITVKVNQTQGVEGGDEAYDYTVVGNTIIFVSPPPTPTSPYHSNIEVFILPATTFESAPSEDWDTIVDGGQFVQPHVGPNRPEELVAIRRIDPLIIDVYNNHAPGLPFVLHNTFRGTNSKGPYQLWPLAQSNQAVFVYKNGIKLLEIEEYRIDWNTHGITFAEEVTEEDLIKIVIMSVGSNDTNLTIMSQQAFVGDGNTSIFTINDELLMNDLLKAGWDLDEWDMSSWDSSFSIFVTVNGEVQFYGINYVWDATEIIFNIPPQPEDHVLVYIYVADSAAIVRNYDFIYDGSQDQETTLYDQSTGIYPVFDKMTIDIYSPEILLGNGIYYNVDLFPRPKFTVRVSNNKVDYTLEIDGSDWPTEYLIDPYGSLQTISGNPIAHGADSPFNAITPQTFVEKVREAVIQSLIDNSVYGMIGVFLDSPHVVIRTTNKLRVELTDVEGSIIEQIFGDSDVETHPEGSLAEEQQLDYPFRARSKIMFPYWTTLMVHVNGKRICGPDTVYHNLTSEELDALTNVRFHFPLNTQLSNPVTSTSLSIWNNGLLLEPELYYIPGLLLGDAVPYNLGTGTFAIFKVRIYDTDIDYSFEIDATGWDTEAITGFYGKQETIGEVSISEGADPPFSGILPETIAHNLGEIIQQEMIEQGIVGYVGVFIEDNQIAIRTTDNLVVELEDISGTLVETLFGDDIVETQPEQEVVIFAARGWDVGPWDKNDPEDMASMWDKSDVVLTPGLLVISVFQNNHWQVGDYDTETNTFTNPNLIKILMPLELDDIVTVVTIEGTEGLDVITHNYIDVEAGQEVVPFNKPNGVESLWISLDGINLHPGIDYSYNEETNTIKVFNSGDEMCLTSISGQEYRPPVAMRLFRDMNDNWEHIRISDAHKTYLHTDLGTHGNEFEVIENYKLHPTQIAEHPLVTPNLEEGKPGFVWINSERIGYWNLDQLEDEEILPGVFVRKWKVSNLIRETHQTSGGSSEKIEVHYYTSNGTELEYSLPESNAGKMIVSVIDNNHNERVLVKYNEDIANDSNWFYNHSRYVWDYKIENNLLVLNQAVPEGHSIRIMLVTGDISGDISHKAGSAVLDASEVQNLPMPYEYAWVGGKINKGLQYNDDVNSKFLQNSSGTPD